MTPREIARRLTRRWRPIEFWLSDPIVAAVLEGVDLDAIWPLLWFRARLGDWGIDDLRLEGRVAKLTRRHGDDHYWEYERQTGTNAKTTLTVYSKHRRMLPDQAVAALVGMPLSTVLHVPGDPGCVVTNADQQDSDFFNLSWLSLDIETPTRETRHGIV